MHRSQALQESDLIFSSASNALKDALGELKRSHLSIRNRLSSIKQDANFVTGVADAYQLPLIANERCGSWYIPPHLKVGSAYFKSTDGHFGQWAFSLRRLNLQVLEVIHEHGGCIIVDSTRRGKSMPDALSKTVPIWATVLNRLLFADEEDVHQLSTPFDVVSESEHAQIEARLSSCLEDVQRLNLDVNGLRAKLKNAPLQVSWQRPGDIEFEILRSHKCQNLIVLCTASNQTSNETSATSQYVQGAADDPEGWSLGLDPVIFWNHQDALLSTSEDGLATLIPELVAKSRELRVERQPALIRPTANLWIGDNTSAALSHADFDLVITCAATALNESLIPIKDKHIHLRCSAGKVGSRQLRAELPKAGQVVEKVVVANRVLITCDTGKDLAVGVALALICLGYDECGATMLEPSRALTINKSLIKQRLSWIMVSMPDASPSRTTLQSVNSFLMG